MAVAPGSGMLRPGLLRRMFGFGLLGVACMTVLAPGILLARGTTGHDWYAAGRLVLEEAKLVLGFSEFTKMAFRHDDGDVWELHRVVFVGYGPPLRARQRLLATIGDGVMLGAGIGGAVLVVTMLGAAEPEPAGRPRRPRPVPEPGRDAAGRLAGGLRIGRTRVALLVVSEAEFAEMAGRDGVADPGERAPDAGLPDALAGGPALPPPPAGTGDDGGEDGSAPAGRRDGAGRIGLWA